MIYIQLNEYDEKFLCKLERMISNRSDNEVIHLTSMIYVHIMLLICLIAQEYEIIANEREKGFHFRVGTKYQIYCLRNDLKFIRRWSK